jgi:ribosomal protein S3
MGQKVHPGGLRVGVIHDWKSNWYTGTKEFPEALLEDIRIREHIYNKLSHAGLSDVLIRKDKQRITIDIYTARPGIVIGKSGAEVDALRKEIHGMTHKNVHININEIKRPELDAKLVAQSIAEQLQNRVSFRRAMKRSLASAIRSGAQGVKVQCGGRLGGTETRLGDQDTARRLGGRTEGLSASRESGRSRAQDREGLGPVQKRRPRRGTRRRATQDNVERPRTDEEGVSAEGREQPEIEPQVDETPAAVADAPDTTTPKKQVEDPTKLEDAGEKD